ACSRRRGPGPRARGRAPVEVDSFRRLPQVLHRRLDAPGLDRHARELQSHLYPAEGPDEREVVEVAEVADPEDLPRELAEPRAERHVELLEDDPPDLVGVVPL